MGNHLGGLDVVYLEELMEHVCVLASFRYGSKLGA